MPLTPDQLDNWFSYHAPTDDTTPRYRAIRDAEQALHMAMATTIYVVRGGTGEERPLLPPLFDEVNAAARALAVVIDGQAPDSADKTAAIRCVRLGRNFANEALVAAQIERRADIPMHMWGTSEFLLACASAEVVKARFQANSAIACGGK
jgi:hypothetical protein